MARYLDPKNDIPFKKVFGEHPELLKSFLNALLPLPEGQNIVEITYLTPEQLPETPDRKNSIVDVKCVENTGRVFIVEMQNYWGIQFKRRMLLNATKAYARQLPRGEAYDLIQPVYTLAVINDIYTPGEHNYYHHYEIVNIENSDEVIEGLEFVLVELPKFVPETVTEKKMRVLWLRFLKEVGETVYKLDPVLLEDEYLKEAVEICEIGAYTRGELEAYDKFWEAVSMDRTVKGSFAKKDQIIAEKDQVIAEKDQAIAEKDQVIAERNQVIAETTHALEKERIELERVAQALAEKDKALAESQKLIEALQKQSGTGRK
ncbi:MAG: Rpn family recombination-promoting nuclease/putative transposase [Tannerella sp.]|jgi:predicted transposase/invertase (TIGR01784 family)|nr:Rpn family recombination-promoting nuclease/putative transposase [Tannerella sp.]